jgi:hypothetical protein
VLTKLTKFWNRVDTAFLGDPGEVVRKWNMPKKIRIKESRYPIEGWHQKYIGEEFKVIGEQPGIPTIYTVDTFRLAAKGEMTHDSAFVTADAAELVEEEPYNDSYEDNILGDDWYPT